jgi:uncharacterized membrane protein
MSDVNRSEAQRRVDEIAVFRAELARLAEAGVLRLDAAQSATVEAHHDALLAGLKQAFDVDLDVQGKQLSLGMRIASFLGALALAASVFFLFYQFWGLLGTPVQVAILVAAPLVALAATAWLGSREGGAYFAKLAALVAFACFVLNLSMLGQIFNITPTDKALLPWAAFALLLAYLCDLRLLLVAGLICLAAFIAARAGTWSGMYWLHFGERPEHFLPAGLLAYWLPQWLDQRRYAGFAATYRVFGLICLLLPILVLGNWGRVSYLPWTSSAIEGFYQTLGFALSAAAIWLGARRGWGDSVNTGVVFFVIFLYTKFYDWWWELMPKWLFFLVVALSAVLLLLVFQRLRRSPGNAIGGVA